MNEIYKYNILDCVNSKFKNIYNFNIWIGFLE